MKSQVTNNASEISDELKHVISLQDRLAQHANVRYELEQRIVAVQAEIDQLKAERPEIAVLQTKRNYVASCVETGDMPEGKLLQADHDLAALQFSDQGIAAQITAKVGVIEGFSQRIAQEKAAAEVLRKECSNALVVALNAEAHKVGSEYVQIASQLEKVFGRLMGLGGILRSITGGVELRPKGSICVPSFHVPVIEAAQKPYPPYQLIDARNLTKGLSAGWIADQVKALRSSGVHID